MPVRVRKNVTPPAICSPLKISVSTALPSFRSETPRLHLLRPRRLPPELCFLHLGDHAAEDFRQYCTSQFSTSDCTSSSSSASAFPSGTVFPAPRRSRIFTQATPVVDSLRINSTTAATVPPPKLDSLQADFARAQSLDSAREAPVAYVTVPPPRQCPVAAARLHLANPRAHDPCVRCSPTYLFYRVQYSPHASVA
ncbi:hypothetical protein KSP39_PZI008539 [Platanthera zijinensis]|uniref:Uncharacterized protein n=1 Tax=Platanthera zijinensis TaxID=2320716 RepID=A0AAP0G848_9ASPA